MSFELLTASISHPDTSVPYDLLSIFLQSIGFNLKDVVAGLAGGIVNTFVFKKSDPWEIMGSITVGGIAANYLGPPFAQLVVVKLFGANAAPLADFAVGLAGMFICQGIIETAGSWKPFKGLKND